MDIAADAIKFENILEQHTQIAIIAHFRPDGDAMGSTTAMCEFLRMRSKHPCIILPSREPDFLSHLCVGCEVLRYSREDGNDDMVGEALSQCTLLLCLDFNKLERTEEVAEIIRTKAGAAEKVMVDHHLEPVTKGFSLVISDPSASSTCELLFRLFMAMPSVQERPASLGSKVLTSLATGLITDTNNFANSLTPHTFNVAALMMQEGVDFDSINNMVYRRYSESRMRLMGYALYKAMDVREDLGAASIVLTLEDKDRYNFNNGDTEGFVNLPLMVKDVRVSALFKETKDYVQVSLRSKAGFSVDKLSRAYFNGGGHERAAGGRLYMPVSQVREYFYKSVEQFLQTEAEK